MFAVESVRHEVVCMTHIIAELEMPECSTGPVELCRRDGQGVFLSAWLDDTSVEEDFYQLFDIFGYLANVANGGHWIREPRQVGRLSSAFNIRGKKVLPDKFELVKAVFRERAA